MNNFWKWTKNEATQERELRIEGIIALESWFDDEISPKNFREELNSGKGDIVLWVNSFGGECYAASQIYTMLKEYGGKVTVKIDGIAASAASVISMAGDEVLISPTALMMIHNPATLAMGDSAEMQAAIDFLNELKESIISAYELKTKLPRNKISEMMTAETYMNAKKAVELGFADKILYSENEVEDTGESLVYSRAAVTNSLLEKFSRRSFKSGKNLDSGQFYKRLNLIAP